jgi:hypothetical protein
MLADRRIVVAEQSADVVGFLVATWIPARRGWLVEQWLRRRSAPNGATHLLIDAAMRGAGAFSDGSPERLVERIWVHDTVVAGRVPSSGRRAQRTTNVVHREPRTPSTLTALRAAAGAAEGL